MSTPEQIINMYGGPAALGIKYLRIAMEANDRGKPLTLQEIFSKIANQIGIKPEEVEKALRIFWGETPES